MFRSRFFRRLFVPYVVLVAIATGAIAVLGAARLRTTYLEDRQHALREEGTLVYRLIEADLREGRIEDARRALNDVAGRIGCRITLIGTDGTVLADTEADPARMDNHRLRPEIIGAAAKGEDVSIRRSDTVRVEMMYLALRVGSGGAGYFVRLAEPLSRLDEHVKVLYGGLAAASGLAVLGAALISYFLARRHVGPLLDLARMADEFAKGDFAHRSPVDETGEMGTLARALNEMADSLSRLMANVARRKEELQTIVAAMSEGLIATAARQNVLIVNPAAAAQLGFEAGGAVGRPLWEVVREEPILKAAGEVMTGKPRVKVDVGPLRDRLFEVTVCPLPESGPPEGLVILVHDRTERARYDEMRKEFVANVSHELRTPLTLIQGFVETLKGGAIRDPAKGLEYVEIVEKHAVQLGNLVDDLLSLAGLESRPGLLQRIRLDAAQVVRKAVDMMAPAAQKKWQSLRFELPAEALVVAGDPDYLQRSVTNLIDNAIKYTPEKGSIRVSLGKGDSTVMIEVSDDGIGIPAEALPRIFERFYRVDKSRSREMGGTGLGLSIVKHIVLAHGGKVTVESEPGKGSTFRIVLPVEPDGFSPTGR